MKTDIKTITRKVEVDDRIPLHDYYRIADNLLKQASIYRVQENIVDLYIILLRFASLVSETIPDHRDYQVLCQERKNYKKKLLGALDELESLKPEVQRELAEIDKPGPPPVEPDGQESTGCASGAASPRPSSSRNT